MNIFRKTIALVMALCLMFSFVACSAENVEIERPQKTVRTTETSQESEASEVPEETAAPENNEMVEVKPVLLVVSFGSSYNETRDLNIGAIENALQEAYPEYEVRRAFTSQTVIDILEEREALKIDNVTEAMRRLLRDGVREVVIQPTHVMAGYEYTDVLNEVAEFSDKFDRIKFGQPLLKEDADFDNLLDALVIETAGYAAEDTAIVFMGHGSGHDANSVYATMQDKFFDAGHSNYFVGTVDKSPTLDEVMTLVEESGAKKVVLLPLMIVAGDHASNDMAGDEPDSWKSVFTEAGYEVEYELKGLGEYASVRNIFVDKVEAAINAPDPLSASQIEDGSYEIEVKSSSPMFNIVKCVLTVEGDSMSALFTMNSDGYAKVFPGTADEADAAPEEAHVEAVLDSEDAVTFEIPLEELNVETDCAAWSIRKEKWYDRTLIFSSQNIPEDVIDEE